MTVYLKTIAPVLGGVAAVALLGVSANAERLEERTFNASSIRVDEFVGTVIIDVSGRNSIRVAAEGDADKLADLNFKVEDGVVVISGEDPKNLRKRGWWRDHGDRDDIEEDYPVVTVTAPSGTDLSVRDILGRIEGGDLGGDVDLSSRYAADIVLGDVRSADIDIRGAADVELGDVAGVLDVDVGGAAEVDVQSAQSADLRISGAGDIDLGDVDGDLRVDSSGAGDIDVESVNGVLDAQLSGAADMDVESGRADPLTVRISGIGDFCFGGVAVDPDIKMSGLGSARIREYEGSLTSRGDIQIGGGC